jgi:IS1 family transposase
VLYLVTAVNRRTRCIVAWDVVTERTFDTMQPVVDHVMERLPQVQQFYSDGLDTYRTLVYWRGRHKAQHQGVPDKSQTYTVEGVNADLRCYVPALDRRGRCFPRCCHALRRLLSLFIACYNQCCWFRWRYPNRTAHPTDFLPTLF